MAASQESPKCQDSQDFEASQHLIIDSLDSAEQQEVISDSPEQQEDRGQVEVVSIVENPESSEEKKEDDDDEDIEVITSSRFLKRQKLHLDHPNIPHEDDSEESDDGCRSDKACNLHRRKAMRELLAKAIITRGYELSEAHQDYHKLMRMIYVKVSWDRMEWHISTNNQKLSDAIVRFYREQKWFSRLVIEEDYRFRLFAEGEPLHEILRAYHQCCTK